MAVYAVSDLHGYADVFFKGLEEIGFSDNDELYVIGDVIDRGPDGVKILTYIKDHDNIDLIIGNHEFMMLNAVDPNGDDICNGRDDMLWLYYNGGITTFEDYRNLSLKERKELLFWLSRRYVIKVIEVGGKSFCLTHSYYIQECENKTYNELDYQTVWEIVWKSMFREGEIACSDIYSHYDHMFVTGHVPVQRVRSENMRDLNYNVLEAFGNGNFIDIDGGCAIGYKLQVNNGAIFLRLDDMKEFHIRML